MNLNVTKICNSDAVFVDLKNAMQRTNGQMMKALAVN